MQSQQRTVRALHAHPEDNLVFWSNDCSSSRSIDSFGSTFSYDSVGTIPVSIFRGTSAVKEIRDSEQWVLLTDGEIHSSDVSELTQVADALDIVHAPLVLIITGSRLADPNESNISVGIPFFASAREALILHINYQTNALTVIDAKGAFEELKPGPGRRSCYTDMSEVLEICEKLAICLAPSTGRRSTRGVSLGAE